MQCPRGLQTDPRTCASPVGQAGEKQKDLPKEVFCVGIAGLEPAVSCSQSRRLTPRSTLIPWWLAPRLQATCQQTCTTLHAPTISVSNASSPTRSRSPSASVIAVTASLTADPSALHCAPITYRLATGKRPPQSSCWPSSKHWTKDGDPTKTSAQ